MINKVVIKYFNGGLIEKKDYWQEKLIVTEYDVKYERIDYHRVQMNFLPGIGDECAATKNTWHYRFDRIWDRGGFYHEFVQNCWRIIPIIERASMKLLKDDIDYCDQGNTTVLIYKADGSKTKYSVCGPLTSSIETRKELLEVLEDIVPDDVLRPYFMEKTEN